MKKTFASLLAVSLAAPALAEPMSAPALNRLFDNNQNKGGAPVFQAESLPSGKPTAQKDLKKAMLQNLDFISSAFSAQYGPGQWKQSHEGWDLDKQIAAAKSAVEKNPDITVDQYHEILRNFFHSMKDYHVSVSFNATEASSLPFSVVSAGGKYYIGWINRDKLPESSFPYNVGDELVGFGGQSAAAAVKGLRARLGGNTQVTDEALAAMMLTSRRAASTGDVAKGPVTVTVKPKGSDKATTRQLVWDYTPEAVKQPKTARDFSIASAGDGASSFTPIPGLREMLAPVQAEFKAAPDPAANPFSIGGRESFLPELGKKLFETPKEAIFHAYAYQNAQGRTIGYIRIPSYEVEDAAAAVKEFGLLMTLFQAKTDALVIDQVDNPGGSVFYLYALASMLTDKPLTTPPHHVAITQEDVAQASEFLKVEPMIKTDADAQKVLGPSADGYPVGYEFFRHMVDYQRFIVDQWNQGKTLTDPTYLNGVDQINPSATVQYAKPILLLINELDFSGGDFFPAIMQDNKRATLFGTRTAGAGGFVKEVSYPNQVGVKGFSMTGSIAVRADNKPIENLGVKADVQYAPTGADLQDGFKEYAKAVNAAMARLLGSPRGAAK